jgi:hypothetical protein
MPFVGAKLRLHRHTTVVMEAQQHKDTGEEKCYSLEELGVPAEPYGLY